jgi:hypothetical protein
MFCSWNCQIATVKKKLVLRPVTGDIQHNNNIDKI